MEMPTSADPVDQMGRHTLRTAPIHEAHDLVAFQEQFEQIHAGIHIEPLHGYSLATELNVVHWGQTAISIGSTTPARCVHPSVIGGGPDDAVVLLGIASGQSLLQVRGSEWQLSGGDVVFARPGHTKNVVTPVATQLCAVQLSRKQLTGMGIDVDAALLRMQQGHPAAALLMQYAHLLSRQGTLGSAALCRAATLHLHDLAALLASSPGAAQDAVHRAHDMGGGVRAARLLAIQRDIDTHITDPALSVAAVARRQGITPRYLQMLLEEDGQTFTALVLEQRLALARRWLTDPRLAAHTISAIAFDAGFGDLSYFNRSFRQRYGMTPSDARSSNQRG